MIPPYPKIWQVGHRAVDGIFNSPVVVQEKVDGSQLSFGKIDGRLYVKSKGQMIVDGAKSVDGITVDGMFKRAVETLGSLFSDLPDDVIFRGEYLNKPKHNVLMYDRVPTNNIVVFDAQSATSDKSAFVAHGALTPNTYVPFDVVPTFHDGPVSSIEELFSFLERESYLGGPKIEGVVIKNYDRYTAFGDPMFAKYVSEKFKEQHGTTWKNVNPGSANVVANLIEVHRTEARWQKAVQHLRESGRLKDDPADIGPLMGELAADFIAECKDSVMDELWKRFGKDVVRGVQRGFAEWYKEQLATSAFGEAA